MADRNVTIGIETTANLAGVDKTDQALSNVAKSGDTAGQSLNEVAASGNKAQAGGVNAAQGFSAASAAASAANGSVQGVAAALGQLAPKLQAINAALPVIGLLMAAFTAWKKVIDALNESQEKQAAGLREITAGNIASNIDAVATSYDRLRQSIEEAQQAQNIMLDGERNMAAARRDAELAKIELEKQQALASEEDPLKRKAITAKAAVRSAGVQSAFGEEDEQRTASALQNQRTTAAASAQAARTQEDVLTQSLAKALQAQGNVVALQQQARDKAWTPAGAEKAAARYNSEIAELGASIKELGAALKSARSARVAADAETSRAEIDIEVNAVATKARGLSRKSGVVAADAGLSQAQAEQRKAVEDAANKAKLESEQQQRDAAAAALKARIDGERQRLRGQAEQAEAGKDPYDARVARETADVSSARSRLAMRPRGRLGNAGAESNLEQQLKELQGAIAARDAFAAQLTTVLASLRKKEEALAEQIKRP